MKSEREFPLRLILLMPLLIGIGLGISVNPQPLRAEIQAVRQASQNENPGGISEHLGRVLAWEPWRLNEWEIAGQSALQAGNYVEAISYFETAKNLQILSDAGREKLGDAYLKSGDWKKAVAEWQSLAVEGKLGEGVFQKILDQQWQHREYADALGTAKLWLTRFPENAQAAFYTGLLSCVEDPPAATASLQQASDLDPGLTKKVETLRNAIDTAYQDEHEGYRRVVIGRALASLEYWDLARRSFEIATQVTPDYAEGWAFLGEAKQQLGEDGAQELKHAQELDPDSLIVKALLALWNRANGNVEEAMALLRQVAEMEPDQVIWQIELGNTAASLGDLYAALQYYQKATTLAPANPDAWLALGDFSVIHQLQPREIGLAAARQALILTSDSAPALDLMGRVMQVLEDGDSAERFLQQAIEKDPAFAAARLHLAQLYLQQNRMDQAFTNLTEALKIARIDRETEMLVKRLLARYFGGQ